MLTKIARALLSRLAPRTYREGDPRPGGQVVFWYDAKWYPGEGRCLERGRMYIDLPPPWEWPQPQIGGSTPYAVVVLIFVGTRLVVSEYPKRPGCFVLPGGKVETGEAPWAAALRETKEETGRDALIEAEPFFVGESHNGKPMWAYRGVLNGTVPEEWAGPEGRVRLSSIDEVRRHYHPGFLPAFDRVMGAVWPDVLQKVTQERDEIAATLADVAKAKVAAEEALAAAEQVQCDLARERAGAGVSSFSSKNEARGYVCERCGKPCEIEVVREMPRPRSRCCHMPARPAEDPGSKAPEVGRTEPWPGSQEEPEEDTITRVKREVGMAPPDWRAAAMACNLALVELLGSGSTECGLELHGVAEAIQRKDPAAKAQAAVARRLARESGGEFSPGLWRHLEALCRALGLPEARSDA